MYFEIILDLYAIAGNHSFTQFAPMVMPCVIIKQHHRPEIDINTVHWSYPGFSSFTGFICVCMCVYLVLSNFVIHVDSWKCHGSQCTEQLHPMDLILCFIGNIISRHPTFYNPYQPALFSSSMILSFHERYINKFICYVTYPFWLFSLNFLELHPKCCLYQQSIHFIAA